MSLGQEKCFLVLDTKGPSSSPAAGGTQHTLPREVAARQGANRGGSRGIPQVQTPLPERAVLPQLQIAEQLYLILLFFGGRQGQGSLEPSAQGNLQALPDRLLLFHAHPSFIYLIFFLTLY